MKKTIFILATTALMAACSGNSTKESVTTVDSVVADSTIVDTVAM